MPTLPNPQDFLTPQDGLRGLNQWRHRLNESLDRALLVDNISIRRVLKARSQGIDSVLQLLWQHFALPEHDLALISVGGYGRGEMLPYSDVDIMILSRQPLTPELEDKVGRFITSLWDIGLAPGVSVRSLEECLAAASDITVATSLVESRVVAGDTHLAQIPRRVVSQTWSDKTFFDQKMQEQKSRYAQHNDTEYNLEPDIKNAPGGLRDINQIGWIAKRHYRVVRLYDLVHLGFISEFEFHELEESENFLWLIRYHLHMLTKRNENRLLFDYQREIATRLGYTLSEDDHPNAAVEEFMKAYYRVAMKVSTLNEILLAYFYESVVEPRLPAEEQPGRTDLSPQFDLIGTQLSVKHHRVFAENPSALLELFYLMGNQAAITGIRARTLRLLMLACKSIDEQFRQSAAHKALFMAILRSPLRLYENFRAMKRYGLLGNYLPAFGQIIGLMQYDLFHIYTVDAHTLILLRNLRRFADPEFAQDFPVVSTVFQRLDRKEIVYLAALFHDIAKGRGGDHSELGAEDAIAFCLAHGLSQREASIVAWLTRMHLLMSLTAQKKDISDPDVVREFAETVGDVIHLDYLYTLTVADINATNPTLWNSWRASLLRQLYTQARRMLRAGLDTPLDRQTLIEDTRHQAMQLMSNAFPADQINVLWDSLGNDYLLRERPTEVAWHTGAILRHGEDPSPLVLLREHRQLAMDAVQIFIYTRDLPNLFAATVAVFDQMNLDVQDARIITATKGFSLDTYIVLDRQGTLISDPDRQYEVRSALLHALSRPEEFPFLVQRRMPRQLRYFSFQPEIQLSRQPNSPYHAVEVITLDMPGLLARIGALFMQEGIEIHSARIATLGERAEDVFFVSGQGGRTLTDAEAEQLRLQLREHLEKECC